MFHSERHQVIGIIITISFVHEVESDAEESTSEKAESDVDDPNETVYNVQLLKHLSYHGQITSQEAQRRLKEFGTRCYLTRYSCTTKSYKLSVCQQQFSNDRITHNTRHFKIDMRRQKTTGKMCYHIDGNNLDYFSPTDMLKFYETNGILPALENIGKCVSEKEYLELMQTRNKESANPDQEKNDYYTQRLQEIRSGAH